MRGFALVGLALAAAALATTVASAAPPQADVRFATFNASLNRPSPGLLTTQLADPTSTAARRRTSPRSSSASARTCS